MSIIVADTDVLIGLAHSILGAAFLKNSNHLSVTEGVYGELTGPRQRPGEETRQAAQVVEACLDANSSFSSPLPYSENDIEAVSPIAAYEADDEDEFGVGEVSIVECVTDDVHQNQDFDVIYRDSDVESLLQDPTFSQRAEFHPATKPLTWMDVERERVLEASLKTIIGTGWDSEYELRELLVRTDIISRAEFENINGEYGEPQLRTRMESLSSDLTDLHHTFCR